MISDLSSTFKTPTSTTVNEDAYIDCVATMHERIVFVVHNYIYGTASGIDGNEQVEVYTSIQSFSIYPNKLGEPYSGSVSADEIWGNQRRYDIKPSAIGHVVLKTTVDNLRTGKNTDGGCDWSSANTNPYGGVYSQAFVAEELEYITDYYDDEGNQLENPTSKDIDSRGIRFENERNKFLILGGQGCDSWQTLMGTGQGFSAKNGLTQLRAIEVKSNGEFVIDTDLAAEQDVIGSNWGENISAIPEVQGVAENGKPYDISAQSESLLRSNDDNYTKGVEDSDMWYSKRSLDGPILGYDRNIDTLFAMGGLRGTAGTNGGSYDFIDDAVGKFENTTGLDDDDVYRNWRLFSLYFNRNHPVTSPLTNLLHCLPDDSNNKYTALLFKYRVKNQLAAKFLDHQCSLFGSAGTITISDDSGNNVSATGRTNRNDNKNACTSLGESAILNLPLIRDNFTAGTSDALTLGYLVNGNTSSRMLRIGAYGSTDDYPMGRLAHLDAKIHGISQVYDDRATPGSTDNTWTPSNKGRYLFTFGRDEDYSIANNVNLANLGVFSGDTSGNNHYTQTVLSADHDSSGQTHNQVLPMMHSGGQNNGNEISGYIYLANPFCIGIDSQATGAYFASVHEAAQDSDLHFFIGRDTNLFGDSRAAGWAVALYDKSASSNKGNIDWGVTNAGGKLTNVVELFPQGGDDDGWTSVDRKYYYKTSFMYDGYQESPLGDEKSKIGTGTDLKIPMKIETAGLNKRITHLNIYRAENTSLSEKPLGFYRLVDTIRLDTAWATTEDTVTTPKFSDYREVNYIDVGYAGADYESSSGISEVIDDTTLKYYHSCQLNNQLFAARVGHRMIEDGDNMIAKSKSYNFDQFDVTKDVLRMPTMPVGIKPFNNRIWVFDENTTHRVEPNSFYIEESFEGSGCFDQKSSISCEAGLFWCNENNMYTINNGIPIPMGDAIKTGSLFSWDQKQSSSYTPIVGYDSFYKSVLFFFKKSSGTTYAWGFNTSRARWDLYEFKTSAGSDMTIQSVASDKTGRLIYSDGANLYRFGTDTTKHKDWEWISKNFTMGHDNVHKKLYKIKSLTSGSGSLTVTYDIASAETPAQAVAADGETIASNHRKNKQIKIKIASGTNDTNKKALDSLGIIFRRLKVTSG